MDQSVVVVVPAFPSRAAVVPRGSRPDGARIPAHVWRETFNGLCVATPPSDAGSITSPTLILWGDRDELLAREQEDDLVRAIPGSRMIVYEGTGHLVLWEQPERVATDLTAFVGTLPKRLR